MEEEIRNEELERIANRMDTNSYTLAKQEMIKIVERAGTANPGTKLEDLCAIYTQDGVNYVKFHGDYKDKIRSIPDFKELVDYLDRNNYNWI